MLEDESGRVRLVGKSIEEAEGVFVTGEARSTLSCPQFTAPDHADSPSAKP